MKILNILLSFVSFGIGISSTSFATGIVAMSADELSLLDGMRNVRCSVNTYRSATASREVMSIVTDETTPYYKILVEDIEDIVTRHIIDRSKLKTLAITIQLSINVSNVDVVPLESDFSMLFARYSSLSKVILNFVNCGIMDISTKEYSRRTVMNDL